MEVNDGNPSFESVRSSLSVAAMGTAGIVTGRTLVAPLSVLKIYAQVGVPGGKMGFLPGYRHILSEHGVRGFYRGNLTACARLVPYTAIQFTLFDSITRQLIQREDTVQFPSYLSLPIVYAAGAVSGVVATTFTHPLDVIKTRLTVNPVDPAKSWYRGAGDAAVKILNQEGLARGLYRGFALSVIGSALYSGMLFTALDVLQNLPYRKRGAPPVLYNEFLMVPTLAMGAAVAVSVPFDLLRKKMMAQSFVLPKQGLVDLKFKGDLIYQIVNKHGIFGFFNGASVAFSKVGPQMFAFTMVYLALSYATGIERKTIVLTTDLKNFA